MPRVRVPNDFLDHQTDELFPFCEIERWEGFTQRAQSKAPSRRSPTFLWDGIRRRAEDGFNSLLDFEDCNLCSSTRLRTIPRPTASKREIAARTAAVHVNAHQLPTTRTAHLPLQDGP